MINIEERISYLLGNTNYTTYRPDKIDPVRHDIPFHTSQNFQTLKKNYVSDVERYKQLSNQDFWCQCGDGTYLGENFPLLIKVRDIQKQSKGILANINTLRHWGNCGFVYSKDIEWENKQPEIVWRGSTTGMNPKLDRKYTRESFVKDYFNKYNVGFAYIVQSCDHLQEYVRNAMSVNDMLRYKYIVSIDGNDKSSSTNWILASNSIPIMPKPRYHSWLCEPWLVPNVHYVEVKEDFSDLSEKIEWCQLNDDKCKEIAYNGKLFVIENFANADVQNYLEKEIIRRSIN